MTPLRQKFISSLELQNYSKKTIKQYTLCIAHFAAHFGKCPTLLGVDETKEYLYHLRDEKKLSPSRHRQTVSAIRYLYSQVLGREWMIPRICYPRKEKPLRNFLTVAEVRKVISVLENKKYRMMLEVLFATGVRCGELVRLKVSDIDSKRMVIVVRDGKGHKGRVTLLSESLLIKLREYYKEYRPKEWLFEHKRGTHATESVPQTACNLAEKLSGIGKKVTPHVLRRSFASALHENDVDVITISRLLGHAYVRTTEIYTEVTLKKIHKTTSPLDLI